jgi:putative ABC transport system permease protein
MAKRVPLAWLQLTHEKLRLLAAVAGIAFAVVMILLQLGVQYAVLQAASLVQNALGGEIVLTSKQYDYLAFSKQFTIRRLYQALAFDGVESAWPVYMAFAQWKNPDDLHERAIFVMGVDPAGKVINFAGAEDMSRLRLPDLFLFDGGSRLEFGPIAARVREKGSLQAEVNGRTIRVIGLFHMGASFGINGTLLSSDLNFLRVLPGHPQDLVELGVIRLKPGADVAKVRESLERGLPPDVKVVTRERFSELETAYWADHTSIGYIFGLGVFMGFVVGTVIVYQILYTDVNDHMAEYATLKALGYGHRYLSSIVLKEALLLSVMGYLPGLAIAKGLYILTARATLLPVDMTPLRMVSVLLLTMTMCCGSGLLAIRKLRQAHPADIF